MGRHLHKLTDRQIRTTAKPLADGGNLWIYPRGNARSWIFRYSRAGRAREMGLGAYPDVPLAEARERAAEHRKILRAGLDPIEHRKAERKRQASAAEGATTFTQCAARYIRAHRHGWRNRKHARQWASTLKTYARPVIGAMPVASIGTDDILIDSVADLDGEDRDGQTGPGPAREYLGLGDGPRLPDR
jgi:hypothetical protein